MKESAVVADGGDAGVAAASSFSGVEMTSAVTPRPGSAPWRPYEYYGVHRKVFRPFFSTIAYPFQKRLPCYGYHLTVGEAFFWIPVYIALAVAAAVAGCVPAGEIAEIPIVLAFMTASHNSIFTFLFGVPFERALVFHKSLLHGFANCDTNASGVVLIILFGALIATSLPPIRRRLFEFFYYLHPPLFIAVVVVGIAHSAEAIIVGIAFWAVDIIVRYFVMARTYSHEATVTILPAKVLRLVIDKKPGNFKFSGGQYVFICVPALALFEWHPFSLSSAPSDESISLHIRVLGNWTQKLHDYCTAKKVEGQPLKIKVYFEGPYGELMMDLDSPQKNYKTVLMISGGIGITPMQSVCNELLDQFERGRPITKLFFVWSCADRYMVDAVYDANHLDTKSFPMVKKVPKSFQPMLLRRLSRDQRMPSDAQPDDGLPPVSPLWTDLHLTKVRNEAEFLEANIHPALQEWVRFGRPDIPKTFATVKEAAIREGDKRVAVLVCGPTGMIDDVRRLAGELSDKQITFDFHHEIFEF